MNQSGDIKQVAVLVGTSRDWGRHLVRGILAYSEKITPWNIWIHPNGGKFNALPENWTGEGIIASVKTQELADVLNRSGLPIVNVGDTPVAGFSAPCVRTDDVVSVQMAAEHFTNRGFFNLAVVGPRHRPTPKAYADAFKQHLAEAGLPCELFATTSPLPDPQKFIPWLKSLPKPVGILAMGHNAGRAVVESCRAAGISVPHDVAILSSGYDELMCDTCFPALSGIVSPTEQIGYKAAELLVKMMQGEKVPNETFYVPPLRIEERLSTETLAVADPRMAQVIAYIRKHAFESIALKDVLQAVPMARRTLDHKFHKIFGHSPVEEIRRLRINKARTLLAQTDLPMQFVAESCGYATYNYLTHVFKQSTGQTPSEYRKKFNVH